MPVTSARQKRFMEGIAHGMKPYGGVGPSKKVAEEMLDKTPSYSRFTSRGRRAQARSKAKQQEESSRRGTQRAKENIERRERESAAERRRRARRGAVRGYKREGGLWDRIKRQLMEGAGIVREEVKKKKGNPHY